MHHRCSDHALPNTGAKVPKTSACRHHVSVNSLQFHHHLVQKTMAAVSFQAEQRSFGQDPWSIGTIAAKAHAHDVHNSMILTTFVPAHCCLLVAKLIRSGKASTLREPLSTSYSRAGKSTNQALVARLGPMPTVHTSQLVAKCIGL